MVSRVDRIPDRRLIRLKIKFAFLQSLSRLFLLTYLDKCKQILLKFNSKGTVKVQKEIKFRRCLFTFPTKREIRHLYVVVVLKQQKSVMHVQSCCFAY